MFRHFFISLLFILFIKTPVTSQWNDAGLWSSITVEKKITQNFSAQLSEELRFNENISELGTIYTDFGISYRIYKNISASANYRFIQKRRVDDFYNKRQRLYFDFLFRHKLSKLTFTLRERVQSQLREVESDQNATSPEYYSRTKFTLKYDFGKKYFPFASAELFYPLNSNSRFGNEIDNVRYAVGVDYEFNKYNAVDLFYLINKELHANDPLTEYIIGIGYTFILPDFKKKSEETKTE